jgi:hypothetical protein
MIQAVRKLKASYVFSHEAIQFLTSQKKYLQQGDEHNKRMAEHILLKQSYSEQEIDRLIATLGYSLTEMEDRLTKIKRGAWTKSPCKPLFSLYETPHFKIKGEKDEYYENIYSTVYMLKKELELLKKNIKVW